MKYSGSRRPNTPVEHRRYSCPICEHRSTLEITHRTGTVPPVLVHCFGCGAGGKAISEASGIPEWRLYDWPPTEELGPPAWQRRGAAGGESARLPSLATVKGWASRLLSSGAPLEYLTDERLLDTDVLARYLVGWDGDEGDLTFPVFAGGELANLLRRKPLAGARMRAPRGHGRSPYPDRPPSGALVLLGGEIDALTGRQMGMHGAVTVSGCNLPNLVVPLFAKRVVYVMFDVGEEIAAARVAARLRDFRATVYVADLRLLGLPDKGDLNDAYRAGIGPERIALLLRRARAGTGARHA
jgi:hypothetical protein